VSEILQTERLEDAVLSWQPQKTYDWTIECKGGKFEVTLHIGDNSRTWDLENGRFHYDGTPNAVCIHYSKAVLRP